MAFGIKMRILEFDSLAIYCSECFVKYTCKSVVFLKENIVVFYFLMQLCCDSTVPLFSS
jgi:hypothetical protein